MWNYISRYKLGASYFSFFTLSVLHWHMVEVIPPLAH